MQIILMHNPKAGRRNHSKRELMTALAKAGHEVIYQSTEDKDYEKALKKSADLVLVAGGDGTVGKVARKLINTRIPLAVLPLGTANNLARSLGFTARPEEIIAGLEGGKKRGFDVGIVQGLSRTRYFFESAGGGLLADYLRDAKDEPNKTRKVSKQQEMRRHVSSLRRLLQDSIGRKWKLEIDDEDISNDYILWEAMNIRSVGPALYLATQAATGDGWLDFVCVREKERSLFMKYLDARLTRPRTKFPLPFRRFRRLRIRGKNSALHFDSDLWPGKNQKPKPQSEIEITVKPSALTILQTARAARNRRP